ncbi:MAG TPA: DUF4062 domain-containing protein [Pyrinomonadaceae bacterium]|nr:DUF4062 domain-containing protein [Pyrinomonadaceae bacterium]
MISKFLVFISSTSDLRDERQALKQLLGKFGIYEPYLYEDEPARRDSPEERCREMVQRSSAFVGLLGGRYGTPYPPPGDSGSIVEWEFDTAHSREDLGLIAVMIKRIPPAQVEPPQLKFIERVRDFRGVWCKEYSTPDDLGEEVLKSLVRWTGEVAQASIEEEQGFKRRLRRVLRPVAVASIVALLLLFALHYAGVFAVPAGVLVGLCALECVLVLAVVLVLAY